MTDETRSSPLALLADVLTQLSRTFRGELALAQAEVATGLQRAMVGVACLAGATVVALTALHLLAWALVAALVQTGLAPGWAAAIVGAAFAVSAAGLVWAGLGALKGATLVPKRALRGIRQDMHALREGLLP